MHAAHLATLILANVRWDPFIRGVLIVVVAVLVLPGSVYLLLATNNGVKLGFLIALAAVFGWIAMMGAIWSIFGIGDQGRPNTWKIKEVAIGDRSTLLQHNTISALNGFPDGWDVLPPTKFGDPQAAADKVLAPNSFPVPEGQSPPTPPVNFQSPYKAPTDYVAVAAYEKGHHQSLNAATHCAIIRFWRCFGTGNDPGEMFFIGRHKFYEPFRPPHYVVLVDQAVRPVLATGGAPPRPVPDTTQPLTYVVMVRDLGSIRQPSLVISIVAGLLFLVICDVMHRRDKALMAAKAAAAAGAGAGGSGSGSG